MVFCVEVEPTEYERVFNIAKEKGVAPVLVTLAIKAAFPGVTVADATAWIASTASIPVTFNSHTYRRVRMP